MRVLRDPEQVAEIADPAIRELLACRFAELSQDTPYDPDEIGHFVLVEEADCLADIEAETGCWLVSNPFSEARYGDPDYAPLHEALDEHPSCYEVVFIFNDSGYGSVLIIPKDDAHPEVLAYCRLYVSPSERT